MAFPASIPSNTDPTAPNKLSSPSHSQLHQSHNAEIVAIETKMGTGSSTPTSGKVLRATGTGTSAWGQTVLSTDIATATSADLRGILSDETGTGVAVFGTSPTIATPIITSPAITTPKITTSINDSNGNEVIKTPATSSAVNEITVTNAATTGFPAISATGDDSNLDLNILGKGTGSGRFAGIYDGWVAAHETWTYASATTFTCSASLAAMLRLGDKIKLTQTTVKYFSVVSISGTTVTITGGTDYSLVNAAITLPFYSHELTPTEFPGQFNYTPTWTNFTVGNGTLNYSNFSIVAKEISFKFKFTLGTTSSASGTIFYSLPVTSISYGTTFQVIGRGVFLDTSASTYFPTDASWESTTTGSFLLGNAGAAYTAWNYLSNTVPAAPATGDYIQGYVKYEAP